MDLWWGSEEDSGAGKVAWCVRGRVEWWRWIRSAEAGFTMRFEDGDRAIKLGRFAEVVRDIRSHGQHDAFSSGGFLLERCRV